MSLKGERYQFTGHEFDSETTYDYHGARYYNRELGRYMSVDPLAMKFFGWSTYNYVMDNPIMLIDPTGKAPEDWIGKKDANGNTTWEWDANVTSKDQLPEGYTEYAKPGDEYPSQDYDSEGNQRWVKLGHGKDKWSYVKGDVNNQGMPVDNDYTEQGLAAQRLHEKLVANSAALESALTNYALTIATLPLGGLGGAGGKLVLSAFLRRGLVQGGVNAISNFGSQLYANQGNFDNIDRISIGLAFGSGFIPGKYGVHGSVATGVADGLFDYNNKGFKGFHNGKPILNVISDASFSTLGNLGVSYPILLPVVKLQNILFSCPSES